MLKVVRLMSFEVLRVGSDGRYVKHDAGMMVTAAFQWRRWTWAHSPRFVVFSQASKASRPAAFDPLLVISYPSVMYFSNYFHHSSIILIENPVTGPDAYPF